MRLHLAALACVSSTAVLAGATVDPPVPPGRDPGGIAAAFVGPGLDYTEPDIASRLARDGEGEIIGYDFADDDRRPYKIVHLYETENYSHPGTAAARIFISESQAARLVAIRAKLTDPDSMAAAIAYAAQSPARIIAIQHPFAEERDIALIAAAARRFADRIFVVPAGDLARNLDLSAAARRSSAPNLIVVTAAGADGSILDSSSWGAKSVDVATDAHEITGFGAAGPSFPYKPDGDIAMARVSALAARILAVKPYLTAKELKTDVLRLAQRPPPRAARSTRAGFIAAPWRPFRLE